MLTRLRRALRVPRQGAAQGTAPEPDHRPDRAAPMAAGVTVPAGIDLDDFLRVARLNFVRMQAAWDAGDLDALSSLATGPLLADLREQLLARGAAPNRTDVLTLQAQLLAFEELRQAWFASVEFSGLIREHSEAGAAPFRELWLLVRPKAGDGDPGASDDTAWQLAGVQSLT